VSAPRRVQVIVAASSTEDFVKWSGYMNSRVKHLTARMHNMAGLMLARPWPKEFKIPMCGPTNRIFPLLDRDSYAIAPAARHCRRSRHVSAFCKSS
jgi:poly(A) polymerase Pap1